MNEKEKRFEEYEKSAIQIIRYPIALARVLRREAESAEEWSNAHKDGLSYTQKQDKDGNWITKRDAYAAKAKMLRDAADIFDPPKQ